MACSIIRSLTTSILLPIVLALTAGMAIAQQKTLKQQLVGTWTFVSTSAKLPDGSSAWGTNPRGQLIFTEGDRYSVQIMRSDLPKYASNNRMKATPEELKATIEGMISYFGTYSVSEADKTITLKTEGSSFPNWTGADQKRIVISLSADELKYTNPATSRGGGTSDLTWKRAK